ncbi:MAG: RapZ C-terminal domain-containing protein [Candidatus Dormibacteria bacterium]
MVLFGAPGAGVGTATAALERAGFAVTAVESAGSEDLVPEAALGTERALGWLVGLDASDAACLARGEPPWSSLPLPALLGEGVELLAAARARLGPARVRADLLLDTTFLDDFQLRARLLQLAPHLTGAAPAALVLESLSYARGAPRDLDWCLDARGLANPYWEPRLRLRSGLDPAVSEFVLQQARAERLLGQAADLVTTWMPELLAHGRRRGLRLAVGCTGGFHRSVALVEELGRRLGAEGQQHLIWHRDLPGPG